MTWMICLFGGIGAMARYVLDVSIQRFSTFSSAINEVLSLIRKLRFAMALGYGAATVAVPLACVALGFGIAMLGGHA